MKPTKNNMTSKNKIRQKIFWQALIVLVISLQVNAQFVWETRAPFADPRGSNGIEGAAAAIIGSTVYVSHGYRGSGDTVFLSSYDILTDTWTHGGAGLPDAPGATQSELGGGTVNGIFYAVGGRNGPVTENRAFNPATSTWSLAAPLTVARGAPGVATVDGKLYIMGGRDGTSIGTGNILNNNEVYDPILDTWTTLTSLPIAVSDNYSTVGLGTNVYVIGGSTGGGLSGTATNAVQIYNTITDTWSIGTPMPTARKAHMAAELCGKITVFGGISSGSSTNLDVTEIYDPVSNTWSLGPALPSPASEIAQGVVGNGKEAYLIGSGFFGSAEQFVFAMVPTTNITVSVDDGNVNVNQGDNITYTITINNAGTVNAPGLVVTDNFPPELGSITWSCTATASATCTASGSGNISDTINLPAAGIVTYTVNATVIGTVAGSFDNMAIATTTLGCFSDATDTNNLLISMADLSISKVDDVDPVLAGNNLVYTVTVNNAGPADAQNVVVTDNLPAGVTFVSSSGCAEDPTGVPSCSLGNIASGANASYTVTVSVDSNTTGTLTNSASVTSSTTDPNAANDSTTEATVVSSQADLILSKQALIADAVMIGDVFDYQLTVINNGPANAVGVVVTDNLPANLTLVSTTGCAEDPIGVPTCTLVDLAPLEQAQYTISVMVQPNGPTNIVNTANVSSQTNDNNPNNNISEAAGVNILIIIPTLKWSGLLLLLGLFMFIGVKKLRLQSNFK